MFSQTTSREAKGQEETMAGDEKIDWSKNLPVAKLRVALPDGNEETWMVPMRLASGPYFFCHVYLPAGAQILTKDHLIRPIEPATEIRSDLREFYTAKE